MSKMCVFPALKPVHRMANVHAHMHTRTQTHIHVARNTHKTQHTQHTLKTHTHVRMHDVYASFSLRH